MAPHKRNPQGSTIDLKFQRMSLETDVDDSHWRFLEEIDAPMWVDLEAEAQFMVQDSDDAWFYTVHPFHQCSSHRFVSSFPLFDNQERPNLSSPNLPGSVSGSRGKHYKKQSWAEATGITSRIQKSPAESDLFQHPIKLLGRKKSLSSISSNDHSTSRGKFTTKTTPGKASKISSGGTKVTISSCGDIADKSCPRPAISRTSRPFSSGSGLLSAVNLCLRKSYVTGHASRVEIKYGRHLKDQKTSSSSKSSIGSSTITGGTSGSGGLGTSRKERTPQSRMASTTVRSYNGLKKASKLTAMAAAQIPERKSNSKLKTCATGTPKVLQVTISRKPLRPLNSTAAPKLKAATKPTQITSALKIQKTSSTNIVKENASKISVQNNKGAACSAKLKDGKGSPLVKGKLKGSTHKFQWKNHKAVARTIHLR